MRDPVRQYVEIEFRDGKRMVADYLAVMMQGIKTHTMTYDEAIAAANQKAEADLLNAKQDAVLAAHFRELR
jgi:hypothetical protein